MRHRADPHAFVVLALAALGLACRPAAPPEPPTASAEASAPPRAPADAGSSGAEAPAPEPDDSLPKTCEITVELLDPGGVTGHGSSAKSAQAAKEAAWADACAQLRKAQGLDCHGDQIAVRKEATGSIQSKQGDGTLQQSHRHTVSLTTRRRATGFGDAMGDRPQACRAAKEHACQQLVGGPCPEDDVRVVEVDGHPPRAADVEPKPADTTPRPTL
ncbi:MAG: hypothetical protein KDK70_06770 [Myxococcales bacterium]|nr:hypothetical protein [Myxococcales bacterium]